MTDIVERLRAMSRYEHDDLSIGDEAADEITALREQNAAQKRMIENHWGDIARDRAEIERLREELDLELRVNATHDEGFDAVVEQNTALRAAAQQARAALRQSRFCLTTLLPHDTDAQYTLVFVESALRALDEVLKETP